MDPKCANIQILQRNQINIISYFREDGFESSKSEWILLSEWISIKEETINIDN